MICLDSDCIIDFLRGRKEAIAKVEKHKEAVVTTEINVFEVFFGLYADKKARKNEEEKTELFFDTLQILQAGGWGKIAAETLAALIKKGETIEQNDCLIAANMIANGCNKIITRNKKHYSRIDGIEVIPY